MKLMLESILAAGLSAARRSALPSALMLGSILAAGLTGGAVFSAAGEPLPFKIPAAVADVQDFQTPDRVHLDGWIGCWRDTGIGRGANPGMVSMSGNGSMRLRWPG